MNGSNGTPGKKWPLTEEGGDVQLEYDPDHPYIGLTSGHLPATRYSSVGLYAADNGTDHSSSKRMYIPGVNLAERHESASDKGCKGKLLDTVVFNQATLEAHVCIDQNKYGKTPFMCVMWNKGGSEGGSS